MSAAISGELPYYPERAPVQIVESPVAYQRLYRGVPGYRWWRPLVAVVLLGVFVVIGTTLFLIIGIVIASLTGQIRFDSALNFQNDILGLAELDAANPLKLAIGLGSVAVILPMVPLALLCAGLRPLGMVSSIAFRLRWRWLLDCLIPAVAVMGLVALVSFVIAPIIDGQPLQGISVDPGTFATSAFIIVLFVPFQAAAEEYVFRGVLMQAIGAWVRFAPLAIVLPTVLFAFGHLYDVWGLLDVAAFGLAAGWITWRTGGLEAGIVMHTVNNVVLFLLLATGVLGGTAVTSDAGSPIALGITIVTMAAYAFWIDRLATRRGLVRRRPLPELPELPPPTPETLRTY